VELATAALACKWDSGPTSGLAQDCPAAAAWNDATQGFAKGRGDETLVAMLEDSDEKTRWLAAQKLHASGKRYREEKPLADRVVTAGERETSQHVGPALGLVLADIALDKTQTFDRVRAMGVRHVVVPLRVSLIANLAWRNPSSSGAYELTREMVHDSEKDVRMAAIQAFWMAGSRRGDETCAILKDNLDDPQDDDVAARAAELLARLGRCQSAYGALLDSEENRLKSGQLTNAEHAAALGYLCEDPKSSHDERDRATQALERAAERGTFDPFVRGAALAAVMKCDPANGKTFIRKFTADGEQAQLKAIAIDLLKPKSR
jgi:hypothetical protein